MWLSIKYNYISNHYTSIHDEPIKLVISVDLIYQFNFNLQLSLYNDT